MPAVAFDPTRRRIDEDGGSTRWPRSTAPRTRILRANSLGFNRRSGSPAVCSTRLHRSTGASASHSVEKLAFWYFDDPPSPHLLVELEVEAVQRRVRVREAGLLEASIQQTISSPPKIVSDRSRVLLPPGGASSLRPRHGASP
jgi:hypothetical protein